jgi:hypothetical protein
MRIIKVKSILQGSRKVKTTYQVQALFNFFFWSFWENSSFPLDTLEDAIKYVDERCPSVKISSELIWDNLDPEIDDWDKRLIES